MNYSLEMFIILVLSGTFGGIVSFFTNKAEEETISKNTKFVRLLMKV
ncbi:hypothetical protein J3D43_003971 [Paenibacillus xylanexedens]|nr:hypothetical protein [Paenibacillus xylanexedens]